MRKKDALKKKGIRMAWGQNAGKEKLGNKDESDEKNEESDDNDYQ